MPRHRKPYPEEFKKKLILLVREGRTPEELARQFEPTAQAIRNWVAQADRDEGRREDGLTTTERMAERYAAMGVTTRLRLTGSRIVAMSPRHNWLLVVRITSARPKLRSGQPPAGRLT